MWWDTTRSGAPIPLIRFVAGAALAAAIVGEVAEVSAELLSRLVTTAPAKDREVEAAKRKARSAQRFAA
jgi:hypothetical protein